jgi:hypothetical protein
MSAASTAATRAHREPKGFYRLHNSSVAFLPRQGFGKTLGHIVDEG